MTKSNTKRALLSSVLAMILCLGLLIGTTFAWFTDSVTSSGNKIKAGTLDVDLLMGTAVNTYTSIADKNAAIFGANSLVAQNNPADTLWEPGKTQIVYLAVENKGNLDLKYNIALNVVDGGLIGSLEYAIIDGAKYGDIDVNNVNSWAALKANAQTGDVVAGTTVAAPNGAITVAEKIEYFALAVHMKEDADNKYQGKDITIDVTVLATQLASEYDSFGSSYDMYAKYDVDIWDGKTVTAPVVDADGVYHITSAANLVGMMNVTGNSIYKGKTIVLDNNIDLGGRTVKGIGGISTNFAGVFDGQGYTISNFKVDSTENSYYAGLFNQVSHGGTIKNLTVKNATIVGNSMVGAVASSLDDAVIDNCKAIDCTLIGVKKVGAVVGYSAGSTVTNNYAENCTVIYSEKEGGKILGYQNTGSTVSNNTANNVSVKQGVAVSSADELTTAIANGASTVVLGSGNYIIPDSAQGKTLTIVGNGNTVVANQNDGSYEGCDYSLDGSTVTFEGVTINTDGHTYAGYARCRATYNNCTINGSYTLYGESVFNNCTFNVTGDYYNIWTWGGKNIKFNDCTFNTDGKSILVYNQTCDVYVDGCTFNDRTNGANFTKSAFETGVDGVGAKYNIYINDTTVKGFAENDKCVGYKNIVGNKNSMSKEYLNIVINGVDVY